MIKTPEGRRRKIVQISPEVFDTLFTVGYIGHLRCTEGLPEDARFCGHGYDAQRNCHYLIFESEQWEPIPFGYELPTQEVRFMRYDTNSLLDRAAALVGDARGDPSWIADYHTIRGLLE